MLAGFHTELSHLNARGKSCAGSGLEELDVAGGVVASESVQNIVWRNYNKGMHFHKLVVEALIHIQLKD